MTVRRVLSDWERTTEESELVVREDCWSRDQCVDDHQRAGAALTRPKTRTISAATPPTVEIGLPVTPMQRTSG